MQNNFKKFLLFNSLILAQLCFLTTYVNNIPSFIPHTKYSQKHNTSLKQITSSISEDNIVQQYIELYSLLIAFGLFFNIKPVKKKLCYKTINTLQQLLICVFYKILNKKYLSVKTKTQYYLPLFFSKKDFFYMPL